MTNISNDLQSYLVSVISNVILNASYEFLCLSFASIHSVFQVLRSCLQRCLGAWKKVCLLGLLFRAREAACRQGLSIEYSLSFGDSNQTHIHVHIFTYVVGVTCCHVTSCLFMRERFSPKKLSPKRGVIGSDHGESLNSHLVKVAKW